MANFVLILCFIYLTILMLTLIFHKVFRHKRFVKYIPGVFSLGLGIYNVYVAMTAPPEGFRDLAGSIFAIVFFVGFLAGTGAGLFLDYVWPKIKKG